MSESYEQIIGEGREGLTIDSFLKNVHPEDVEYFSQCEQTAAQFLFEFIDPEKMLDYKVSYCYRLKTADQNYRLFLHQAIGLTKDDENRLGKVLGVHSDISHLMDFNNKISFIGIGNVPSYMGLDPVKGFKEHLDVNPSLSAREREVLKYLSEGDTVKEISSKLRSFISLVISL